MSGVNLSRDQSIDALKGLAIVLVVVGHAIIDAGSVDPGEQGVVNMGPIWISLATASSPPLSLIYSFHLPLFAFVSGLVMWPPRDYSLTTSILSRVRGLLVPYMAWFVLLYAVRFVPHPSRGFGQSLGDAVLGRDNLWYLYALFICTAIVLCLESAPGTRWTLPLSVVGAIIGFSGVFFAIPNVLYLDKVFWVYPFVVLGYVFGPLRAKFVKHRWRIVAVSLAAFVPLFYLLSPVHVPSLQPINKLAAAARELGTSGGRVLGVWFSALAPLLPYACGVVAVTAIYALYLGRTGKAIDVQAWIGRRSLGIYAIEGPVLWWLSSNGLTNVFVLVVVALGISVAITVLLERTPLIGQLLLGQRIRKPHRQRAE
ncbi:MAG: acyltransferase family protein [Coriobacteriia bacterium]|nr:acyltransferase family protein [Coriobacteriia bacterium]